MLKEQIEMTLTLRCQGKILIFPFCTRPTPLLILKEASIPQWGHRFLTFKHPSKDHLRESFLDKITLDLSLIVNKFIQVGGFVFLHWT
jgi:hypothetical protein